MRWRPFTVWIRLGDGWSWGTGGAGGWAELADVWSWGMCGAGGWVELGDGWSWEMGGAQEGFSFLFRWCVFLRFNSILLGAAINGKKKIFATVASRAY